MLINNERILDSKYGNYGYNEKDIPEHLQKKKTQTKKKFNVITGGKHTKKQHKRVS